MHPIAFLFVGLRHVCSNTWIRLYFSSQFFQGFKPETVGRRMSDAMTIAAPNIAFRDFSFEGRKPAALDQLRNFMVFVPAMIEVQDNGVSLSTINAGMNGQILHGIKLGPCHGSFGCRDLVREGHLFPER